jgi:Flp pilus assembly pilin Flp
MESFRAFIANLYKARGQEGQGMVEYSLILVMVGIVVVFLVSAIGSQVFADLTDVSRLLH